MRIDGTAAFPFAHEQVWAAFTDPDVLRKATPGCQSLEQVGPDQFEAVMKMGVAGITGTYKGSLQMTDKQPPERFTLLVQGQGSPGFMKGSAQFAFSPQPDGSTAVAYAWDIEVGGLVAGVGQRVLSGVAKMMIDQFFKAIRKELETAA